jgi:hypothetical protein
MELNISDFDDYSEYNYESYNQETYNQETYNQEIYNQEIYNQETYNQEIYDETPENKPQIKVIKKTVHFDNKPVIKETKPTFSYEDILLKMGMFVDNGKLHLINNTQQQYPPQQYSQQNIQQQNIPQNSYIYNKYFKDQLNNNNDVNDNRPLTPLEYRNKLIKDIIQKHKIKQLKTTKLIMPTSNISMGGGMGNLNKLFNFSKR